MATNFKELKIKTTLDSFTGDKIKIDKVINVEITVHKYRLVKSKYETGDGLRLDMQITKGDEQRLLWSSSAFLKNMIGQIPKEDFPFKTTIVKINDHYEFT